MISVKNSLKEEKMYGTINFTMEELKGLSEALEQIKPEQISNFHGERAGLSSGTGKILHHLRKLQK